jgi:hypothetical protein
MSMARAVADHAARRIGLLCLLVGLFSFGPGVAAGYLLSDAKYQPIVAELQAELDKPDPASCACLNEVKIQKMCAAGVAGAIDQAVQSGQAEELLEILTKRSGR